MEVAAGISSEPLDVSASIAAAVTPQVGGLASFVGTVRATPAVFGASSPVVRLEYEAHPTLAAARMEEIAREAAHKWSLERVVAFHRTGRCELGEPTVVIACGAGHRHDALEACRWIIDEVKATVPIWKKEVYGDGSSEWLEEVASIAGATDGEGATGPRLVP